MHVFLAGIMQGSHLGAVMHHQGYRGQLRELLSQHWPDAKVYDPLADHQQSLDYDVDQGRAVFLHHNKMCGETDVLIAFVPEASMGTAIEMWEAWKHGRLVIAISPLSQNWAVRYCSHLLFPDVESFESEVVSGDLLKKVHELQTQTKAGTNDRPGSGYNDLTSPNTH